MVVRDVDLCVIVLLHKDVVVSKLCLTLCLTHIACSSELVLLRLRFIAHIWVKA